jgi:hypothetical protein
MGEAAVAKATPGIKDGAPKAKPAKLTFGRKAVLLLELALIGGSPAFVCMHPPDRPYRASGASAVMSAENPAVAKLSGACKVDGPKDEFKPAMNIQGAKE